MGTTRFWRSRRSWWRCLGTKKGNEAREAASVNRKLRVQATGAGTVSAGAVSNGGMSGSRRRAERCPGRMEDRGVVKGRRKEGEAFAAAQGQVVTTIGGARAEFFVDVQLRLSGGAGLSIIHPSPHRTPWYCNPLRRGTEPQTVDRSPRRASALRLISISVFPRSTE